MNQLHIPEIFQWVEEVLRDTKDRLMPKTELPEPQGTVEGGRKKSGHGSPAFLT